jgi:hypothetical protein
MMSAERGQKEKKKKINRKFSSSQKIASLKKITKSMAGYKIEPA